MDPKIAGVLLAIIIVAAGAGAIALKGGHRSGSQASPATTATSSTTSSPSNTGTVRLEGTWHGSYHGKYGSGEWTWVIVEESRGNYKGCLKTTGTYAAGWMPIRITVSGSKITVGTVGPNAVTFTGTIRGGRASGTWKMTGQPEGGDWSGTRTSSAASLPCMTPTETGSAEPAPTSAGPTATTPETPTTQSPSQTTTSPGAANLVCTPPPPPGYQEAYNTLIQAAAGALGADNLHCVTAFIVGGVQYSATYKVHNYDPSQGERVAAEIKDSLEAMGWNYTRAVVTADLAQVQALGIVGGSPFLAYVSIQAASDGSVNLMIQLQPYHE